MRRLILLAALTMAATAGAQPASPLAGIWRGERLADDTEQVKLQALNDAIDEAAGFTPDDHRAVEFTAVPKGIAGRDLDGSQRDLLLSLLGLPPHLLPPLRLQKVVTL